MSREANPPYDEGPGTAERMDYGEETQSFGSKMKDRATQFGTTVSQTMDRQRENAAKGLDRAASTLHEGTGSAARMAHGVADGMQSTASYLRSHTWGDMGSDVGELCRRHPVQALVSAGVLGFLLGRAIRR
jgi:ElaB/YqjD/DUF883 family membrane-anchored ribosome-binding protein